MTSGLKQCCGLAGSANNREAWSVQECMQANEKYAFGEENNMKEKM